MPIVTLSDGQNCKVRQLGLVELDGKGREVIGPYCYTVLTARGVFDEDEYVFPPTPPIKPDIPESEIVPESQEWQELREWETYQAALSHEQKRRESYEGFVNDIVHYIVTHCLNPEDVNRVITAEDWDTVYLAAIVPELTLEGLSECLDKTFSSLIWQPAYP